MTGGRVGWAAGKSSFAWRSSGSDCRAGEMAAPGGDSSAGAVGFSGAAADVPDEKLRLRVANAAWARWTPMNFVGIATHLVGEVGSAGEQGVRQIG